MEKIKLTINGKEIEAEATMTVLEACNEAGVDITTLCYLKDYARGGICQVCLVSVEGKEQPVRSCITKVEEGMVITTSAPDLDEKVKENITKLAVNHEFDCDSCVRLHNCELLRAIQKYDMDISKLGHQCDEEDYLKDDSSVGISRDSTKCIMCGRCVNTCTQIVGAKILKYHRDQAQPFVAPEKGFNFDSDACLLCGQCVVVCPTATLKEKDDIGRVMEAIKDPSKHVIAHIAPSIRTALGEEFGLGYGKDVTAKAYAAIRELGFDGVFDTNFGADFTIVEEATEFVDRVKNGGVLPMFTSCCPSWVRYVEYNHHDLLPNLSTCKSPVGMFGAIAKSYYADKHQIDPKDIVSVAIMPCISKKFEVTREEMENDGVRNNDLVLTNREFARMIKQANIDFLNLEDQEPDHLMADYSGAGTIFGATGGVMEASLRTAASLMMGDENAPIEFGDARGFAGIKEFEVQIGSETFSIAVVSGGANMKKFVTEYLPNKQYHFVEYMACQGGCINGGGQPHVPGEDRLKYDYRKLRASVLYNQDQNLTVRRAHQNPMLINAYESYLGTPGHGKAHDLLHTSFKPRFRKKLDEES